MRDKLRVGLVGVGWWAAKNHLPILKRRTDVEVVAVCRLGRRELNLIKESFDVPIATESYDEMLEQAALEAVIVSSPHELHARHARQALDRGLHVLVEKPMATSTADAKDLAERAAKMSRHLLVPYGWNFRPYMEAAEAFVRHGRIGKIRHVVAQMASPAADLFTGQDLAGTETDMFRPSPETWARSGTGGYGWGQLVHVLGALFFLTDLVPEEVFAFVTRSDFGGDLYDAAAIRCADGATISLSGAATAPHGSPFQFDIRLFGSEGMLLIDAERERVSLCRDDGDNAEVPMNRGDGAYACIEPIERFIDLCHGRPVRNNGDATIGLRSVEVVDAMLRSASSGRSERARP